MATVPRIESRNLSIADLFKEFYAVPDFQREYVWEKDNVDKLLEDILHELYDENELVSEAEYFLGSIVVFRDESGTSQLIDGQQRLTTVYLIAQSRIRYILAKLSQYLDEQAYDSKKTLDSYINKSVTIEHILPKSAKKEAKNNFDKPNEYLLYVEKLGI